ncbi:MAG: 16S rRNA (guanine(966)-N(2))-methyltransferase RsmD [Candidatus Omnitrophica bacterium]|nr:16S rRNA (guanine(966)-N(2))-methyltransferase RsmD [Candidatus Omnitrophota bacterium]
MRIIAGQYRGRTISMPGSIRPTQDRVREAIFNVIKEVVPGALVLDLFAGSGAFGIEALSRDAQSVVFVDNNIKCIRIIRENLSFVEEAPQKTQLLKLEAVKAIERLEKQIQAFDLVFLDPPYYKGLARNSLIKIGACDILKTSGFVIAEHSKKDELPRETGVLRLFKEKRYGDTVVSFYNRSQVSGRRSQAE